MHLNITMCKRAVHAAEALGGELVFQGGPDFNPTVQVPVRNAVIDRHPDAILIAPLKQAIDAGIKVVTVDTIIDDGRYLDGRGEGDFPLSYIASDNVFGSLMAGHALAKAVGEAGKIYVSNVKPGISTTHQREEGFKTVMEDYPDIEVLETQFNDDNANKSASQLQGGVCAQSGSGRRVRC